MVLNFLLQSKKISPAFPKQTSDKVSNLQQSSSRERDKITFKTQNIFLRFCALSGKSGQL